MNVLRIAAVVGAVALTPLTASAGWFRTPVVVGYPVAQVAYYPPAPVPVAPVVTTYYEPVGVIRVPRRNLVPVYPVAPVAPVAVVPAVGFVPVYR